METYKTSRSAGPEPSSLLTKASSISSTSLPSQKHLFILVITPYHSTIIMPHRDLAMAILPAVPAFSTTILVDGEPVDEYQPPHIPIPYDPEFNEEMPRTRCFIAAETGCPYSIRFRLSPLFDFADDTDTLIVAIFIDGTLVEQAMVSEHMLGSQVSLEKFPIAIDVYANGSSSVHSFVFRDLSPG
jgi:hypothetical protein